MELPARIVQGFEHLGPWRALNCRSNAMPRLSTRFSSPTLQRRSCPGSLADGRPPMNSSFFACTVQDAMHGP